MTTPFSTLTYTTDQLNRLAHLRRDSDWLQALWARPHRLWAVADGKPLLSADGRSVVTLPPSLCEPMIDEGASYVVLGEDGATGTSVIVIDATGHEAALQEAGDGSFQPLRPFALGLPPHDSSMLSYARSLFVWHRSARFCGGCGSPTRLIDHGHARKCTNEDHGEMHFPRINPAVIMAVGCGEHLVLARGPHHPPGLHSVLAGYIEHGESIEQATVREVAEEVGIDAPASSVRYLTSQPWPYSNSLMLGTLLEVEPGPNGQPPELVIDFEELASARWYHRDEVRAALSDDHEDPDFWLPPRDAVARILIEHWLQHPVAA